MNKEQYRREYTNNLVNLADRIEAHLRESSYPHQPIKGDPCEACATLFDAIALVRQGKAMNPQCEKCGQSTTLLKYYLMKLETLGRKTERAIWCEDCKDTYEIEQSLLHPGGPRT